MPGKLRDRRTKGCKTICLKCAISVHKHEHRAPETLDPPVAARLKFPRETL